MNKKVLIIVLIISVVINLAAVATLSYFRWTRHRQFGRMRGDMPPWIAEGFDWNKSHLKDKLNLTDEQIDALNTGHEEMRIKTYPLMEDLFTKRKALLGLLKDAQPDSVKADSIIREVVVLQIELESKVFKHMQKMRNIFTPEQQEILMELFEERMPPGPPLPHMPPLPHGHGRVKIITNNERRTHV